jgi:ABC-type hemin transport system substrate-binding protein
LGGKIDPDRRQLLFWGSRDGKPMSGARPGAPRIASLVPSLTELVFALGLGERLVARTGFCVHPRERVGAIAKVGGTKDVNLAKLRRLAPTHVLANVDENRRETIEAIRAWGDAAPEIVVTHPCDPLDNLALVDQLAAAFAGAPGLAERAATLRADLAAELAATTADGRLERRVLYLIWHGPWMTVARDTYLSRMLARIGWQTLPEASGGYAGAARYPVLAGTEPWLAVVERVLLSSEPFAFGATHVAEACALCPAARVQRVDGELLGWYGARAVAGLRYLRGLADDNDAPPAAP